MIINNLQIEIDIQLGSLIIDRFIPANVMYSLFRGRPYSVFRIFYSGR